MIRALALVTFLFLPVLAHAQDAHLFRAQTSCSARSIDEFYCPDFADYLTGPYFDNGCSVTCKTGQKATCIEAHCEDGQTGQPVYSTCSCK